MNVLRRKLVRTVQNVSVGVSAFCKEAFHLRVLKFLTGLTDLDSQRMVEKFIVLNLLTFTQVSCLAFGG